MRALLLHNPRAGRAHARSAAELEAATEVLREAGFSITLLQTTAAGSATRQAREALDGGVEVIFACGGDGTVHEVLQATVGTNARLGVLPAGTSNVLARELGISRDLLQAARQYRRCATISASVGRATDSRGQLRYFLAMAGAGPDGHLSYTMAGQPRGRWGSAAYDLHALRLYLQTRFHEFPVRYRICGSEDWHRGRAAVAMLLRVADLGGVFRGAADGGAMDADGMHLVLVRGPAIIALPLWFVTNWLGMQRLNPFRRAERVVELMCDAAAERTTYVQLDGESFGTTPVHFALLQDTVHLLVPRPE